MPSLLRHRACPVCGSAHNFCLPRGEIIRGQTFDFRCPQNDRSGELLADESGGPARFSMQGAVERGEVGTNRPME